MKVARNVSLAVAGIAAAGVLVTSGGVASAGATPNTARPAAAGGHLVLPAPTGAHPVGWSELHLVDRGRMDPWVPTAPRELMVSVWYPAAVERGPRVPYATAEESRLMLTLFSVQGVPLDALTRVHSHARAGAPPVRTPKRLPLVLLSPGFGHARWLQTSLAEDLASRGYLVVGVDHNYEAAAVTFPDGRVTQCLQCLGSRDPAKVVANRAKDLSFVLDSMLKHHRYGRMIDAHRIAAVGHSNGGAASLATMLNDPRVDAGINMDGSFHPPLDRTITKPFMLLGSPPHARPSVDPSWEPTWAHLGGWRRWLSVSQINHDSASDVAVVGEWLGVQIQPLPGKQVLEIVRSYVAAFLDQHLRHRHRSLLDRPSRRFPDVHFEG
jgi:pimeloyl-ACP methyl ester carboxylesterase